ncbi:hypothetical protein PYCC9005_003240 [Savitreella phatthalungensis]
MAPVTGKSGKLQKPGKFSKPIQGRSTGPRKSHGFKMRPLAEGAYRGKQDKVKQALIQKHKLRKEYAKVLKRAGLSESSEASFKTTTSTGDGTTEEDPEAARRARVKAAKARSAERKARYLAAIEEKKAARTAEREAYLAEQQARKDAREAAIKQRELHHKRAHTTNARGQPKLGDRMANMLDRIRRQM